MSERKQTEEQWAEEARSRTRRLLRGLLLFVFATALLGAYLEHKYGFRNAPTTTPPSCGPDYPLF